MDGVAAAEVPEYPAAAGVSRRTLLRFAPLPEPAQRWAAEHAAAFAAELLDNPHTTDRVWAELVTELVTSPRTAVWASPHRMSPWRRQVAFEVVLASDPAAAARPLAWLLRDGPVPEGYWPAVTELLVAAANLPGRVGGSRRKVVEVASSEAVTWSARRAITAGLTWPDRAAALLFELGGDPRGAHRSDECDAWFLVGSDRYRWMPGDDLVLLVPVAELAARRPRVAELATHAVMLERSRSPEERLVVLAALAAWRFVPVDDLVDLVGLVQRPVRFPQLLGGLASVSGVPAVLAEALSGLVPQPLQPAERARVLLERWLVLSPSALASPPRAPRVTQWWHPLDQGGLVEEYRFGLLSEVAGVEPWRWAFCVVVAADGEHSSVELAALVTDAAAVLGADAAAWRLCVELLLPLAGSAALEVADAVAVAAAACR